MADYPLPNLFIIGAPKAGTTLLHNALSEVPLVYMSQVKEPGFFASDRHFAEGTRRYSRAYFRGSERYVVRGESTPWYLYSSDARARIGHHCPGAKAIALVRRPADRALSMYLDQVAAGTESRSFEDAIHCEQRNWPGRVDADVRQRYLWASMYSEHLVSWAAAVGRSSLLVLRTDDLSARPTETWARLSGFLELDLGLERITGRTTSDRNVASRSRWPKITGVLRSLEGSESRALALLKRIEPPGLRRTALQSLVNYTQTPLPLHQRPTYPLSDLDDFFADEIARLEKVAEFSLDAWRAPRVPN